MILCRKAAAALACLGLLLCSAPASAAELPAGFVRLSRVELSIRQEIRYAGSDNFLGRPAEGYLAPECILTEAAASALGKAQRALQEAGLTLVVFDCYRPESAVADFVGWARAGHGTDPRWHPRVRRSQLVAEGYIGRRSAHSRGSTVDVALAPVGGAGAPDPECGATGTGSLDFGTGFDCFDPRSGADAKGLSRTAESNREKLLASMQAAGFRAYSGEWWHFTLRNEPFPKQRFDFPVTAE